MPVSSPVLQLEGFGVAFGERIILSAVDLQLPEREVTCLLGPTATGKSTLLRTLAGFNDANPNLRLWGKALYAGEAVGTQERPAMVAQSARLMMASVLENILHELPERGSLRQPQQRELAVRLLEKAGLGELKDRLAQPVVQLPLVTQRHLAMVRLAAAGPRLLFLDEPTAGLNEAEAEQLLHYILQEKAQRAMLVVLHNQRHAQMLGGNTALLAGGVVQEAQPTAQFFAAPRSAVTQGFIRSGSCSVASPDCDPATLDPATPPPAPVPQVARDYVSDSFGPRGFLWLKKGRLAGTPRPGVVHEIEYDLQALKRVGVTRLLSLTERAPEVEEMAAFGIGNVWSPIPDMQAPPIEQAVSICRQIDTLLEQQEVVAVHCRAGLGRTGTVLAAYLIWEGSSALSALEAVRKVEPRWVQSEVQVAFLESFAQAVADGSVATGAEKHAATTQQPLTMNN
jgi:atypical dual specificity phosphatase